MPGSKQMWITLVGTVLVVVSHLSAAHHLEDPRTGTPIDWRGTIRQISWDGAHVMFMVEVPDVQGQVKAWRVLGASPKWLARRGIGQHTLRVGEAVEIVGFLDRFNHIVSPLYFQRDDGTRLYLGFTQDGSNPM